ncbi:MAG: DUF748 domain-containing protein [Candidatus Omnitrophota bacterium]
MTKNNFATFTKIKEQSLRISSKPLVRKTVHVITVTFFIYSILGLIIIPLAAKILIQAKGPEIIKHPVKVKGVYLNPYTFTLGVSGFQITDKEKNRLVGFNRFVVNFQISSLWRDAWHLKLVDLDGFFANITLRKDGTINLADLVPAAPPEKEPASEKPENPGKKKEDKFIRIDSISFSNGAADFRDEHGEVPFSYTLAPVNFTLDHVSTRADDSHAMRLTLLTRPAGKIELSTHCNINPLQCLMGINIESLALSAFQPYAGEYTLTNIADGVFNLWGELVYKAVDGANNSLRFQGETSVEKFALKDARDNTTLAGWNRFSVNGIQFNLFTGQLMVDHVLLDGLNVAAVLEKDGQINFAKILKNKPAAPADPQTPVPVSAAPSQPPSEPLQVMIRHVELKNGNVRFNDQSVSPEFNVVLSDMESNLKNVSNAVDNKIDFDFLTVLDEKGMISLDGFTTPFSSSTPGQVTCKLENYDMTALTPYMGKYLGYEVKEGTFNIDVSYDYSAEKMVGSHELLINKFTLGQTVDSPDALKVPIKLAISILEDINRRIDLALPVKGSPKDPAFKFTGMITKTLTNLMTKVVLSPFSLLGGIVGEGEEDVGVIAFDPGSTALTEQETKKLLRLTKSLSVRPRISLEIKGYVDPQADGWELKEASFDRLVEQMTAENKKFKPDTLKKLYVKDFGLRKLWALNKQYQSKSVTDEMAEQMRLDLIAVHKIDDELLAQMARSRARAIYDALIKEGGIPPERITLSETFEKTSLENNRIQNKLSFSIKE